jgi:hypothetical protein
MGRDEDFQERARHARRERMSYEATSVLVKVAMAIRANTYYERSTSGEPSAEILALEEAANPRDWHQLSAEAQDMWMKDADSALEACGFYELKLGVAHLRAVIEEATAEAQDGLDNWPIDGMPTVLTTVLNVLAKAEEPEIHNAVTDKGAGNESKTVDSNEVRNGSPRAGDGEGTEERSGVHPVVDVAGQDVQGAEDDSLDDPCECCGQSKPTSEGVCQACLDDHGDHELGPCPFAKAEETKQDIEDCGNCIACGSDRFGEVTFANAMARRMVTCSHCGNKRCPHATDHRLTCTNSNEEGQAGSVYIAPNTTKEAENG